MNLIGDEGRYRQEQPEIWATLAVVFTIAAHSIKADRNCSQLVGGRAEEGLG